MKRFRSLISVTACFFITLAGFTAANNVKVSATPNSYIRLAGNNRYLTSISVSENGWPQGSDYVVLASGENFPDALCAAPLAKLYDAPILLTPHDSLTKSDADNSLEAEIKRLNPTKVFIVGGTEAISDNVIDELAGLGISRDNCVRIAGSDRYGTSLEIADKILQEKGSISGTAIASGETFPDALSIAPVAASANMPILLSGKDTLSDDIKTFINTNNAGTNYVIGGTGVISDSAVSGISNVNRLSGQDRYHTNLAIINEFTGNNTLSLNNLYVATGSVFADALSGSAEAALDGSAILLASNTDITVMQDSLNFVHSNLRNISSIKILGGAAAISDWLANKIVTPDRIVLGYTTYYSSGDTKSLSTMQNYPSTVDEIGTFTYTTNSSGTVTNDYPVPSSQISYAKSTGIKPLALVTDGFDNGIVHPLLSNDSYRKNFINNIIKIIQANGYSGVNIDFEGMKAYDRNNYTTFVKELYSALHPLNYLVTLSVEAKTYDNPNDNWTGPFDYAQLGNYADQIAIMTYDYSYYTPGPISPMSWVQDVVNYAVTVIPRNKILLGLEAYGKDWCQQTDASGNIYYTSSVYGVANTLNLASQYNAKVTLDSSSLCEHFSYTDSTGHLHQVWFDDGTSVAYKLNLVNSEDLGGVALWDLAFPDADYMNQIKTIFKK